MKNRVEGRAIGKSTRLIDKYIQEFFTNPQGTSIYVLDHWDDVRAHSDLLKRVVSRLKIEHEGVNFSVDRLTNSIMRLS